MSVASGCGLNGLEEINSTELLLPHVWLCLSLSRPLCHVWVLTYFQLLVHIQIMSPKLKSWIQPVLVVRRKL